MFVFRTLVWCLLVSLMPFTPASALAQGTPVTAGAPVPIAFPRDDGVHDSNIEWWYFTGHLFTAAEERYGFEYVIFRARNGGLEGYVAHFAVTDNPRREFHYDQRIAGANGVAGNSAALDLDLDGWTMVGENGVFSLAAEMPGYTVALDVETTKPPALHDGDGYIEYGDGTASYYYSWTRLTVSGTLDRGDGPEPVSGEAWMDHQWGNFETFQDGGWDWFALQLEDGTDVMLYLIRNLDGEILLVDGSIVDPDGALTVLRDGDFTVTPTGEWTSPQTGTTYPSGWEIAIPSRELSLTVAPTLPDQELDTRPTTGVIYWEGEALVSGTSRGEPIAGLGYVELTGYAPVEPLDFGTPVATPEAEG
jgi:predicted secreted hydrolase